MMWSIRNLFLHAYVSLQSLSIEDRLQFLNRTVNLSTDWSQLASGWFCTQLIFIKCYCAVAQLPKSSQGQFQGFSLPKDFVPKRGMASFILFFSAKTAHWRSAATPCQSFFSSTCFWTSAFGCWKYMLDVHKFYFCHPNSCQTILKLLCLMIWLNTVLSCQSSYAMPIKHGLMVHGNTVCWSIPCVNKKP